MSHESEVVNRPGFWQYVETPSGDASSIDKECAMEHLRKHSNRTVFKEISRAVNIIASRVRRTDADVINISARFTLKPGEDQKSESQPRMVWMHVEAVNEQWTKGTATSFQLLVSGQGQVIWANPGSHL